MTTSSAFHRFPPRLQAAIGARLSWTSLREVQNQAGHAILDGHNAVVLAPTAGGKTEAAMFPVLADLIANPGSGDSVRALYIAPIKALLNNQADRLGLYTEMVGLDRFLWHGDVTQGERKKFLRDPVDLLMTTPESLEVMLVSPKVATPKIFKDLRFVIIDEVHALAGVDRGAHLMSVLERIARFTSNDIQRVGLSATVGNPAEILRWLKGTSKREGLVVDPPKEPATRRLKIHLDSSIAEVGDHAAKVAKGTKSLFFCESRALTESVAERLRDRGTNVFVHHSSVSLEERGLAEESFKGGADATIVCTSTLELGIDVGNLDAVFQSNAPSTVSSYLQRMGRTGRRDNTVANTTFFCDNPESVLQAIALVELAREHWVESVSPQSRCWPVLVHQLLAMTLQFGAITRANAWEQLSRVPDLRDVTEDEFKLVVDHMVARQFLYETGGMLAMGDQAERQYGRKNFMELYAVFSSPEYYRVLTATGRELGSLEQQFVDSLVESMTSFLLGGRAWVVETISHKQRTVSVRPAPRGKKPSWGGFAPSMLSYELCQRIRKVITDTEVPRYLSDDAARELELIRDDMRDLLAEEMPVQVEDGAVRWFTYAGGRINQTLKHAIAELTGWKVVSDNFLLRFEGSTVGPATVEQAVRDVSAHSFWEDTDVWQRIIARIPPYRLSKFQPALPNRFQTEMLGTYLLDVPGTKRFLLGDGGQGALELLQRALAAIPTTLVVQPERDLEPDVVPNNPVRYLDDDDDVVAICADLLREPRIGLDVETTLTRDLCVVQFSTDSLNIVIDALALSNLGPIADVLESTDVEKIIHNASFERSVFHKLNIGINNIFDTLPTSRRLRGRKIEGGHGLGMVAQREIGREMNKEEQMSDWRRRPLTKRQLAYAAMDVEVLIPLRDKLAGDMLIC